MMFVLMAIYRVWPGPRPLLLPLWLAMALGFGLLAGALMVKYRDIRHLVPTFLQLGLHASPVAWSTMIVPVKNRWVFMVNPLTGLLEGFRWSLLGDETLSLWRVVYSAASALLMFWLGAIVFKQQERDFVDVI